MCKSVTTGPAPELHPDFRKFPVRKLCFSDLKLCPILKGPFCGKSFAPDPIVQFSFKFLSVTLLTLQEVTYELSGTCDF